MFYFIQIQDQENVYANKGKGTNLSIPVKRQGLAVRGALGDVNTNVQAQRDVNIGKVAVAAAEYEKKATLSRAAIRRSVIFVCSTHILSPPMKISTIFIAGDSLCCLVPI